MQAIYASKTLSRLMQFEIRVESQALVEQTIQQNLLLTDHGT
jgi:hypothetical protein